MQRGALPPVPALPPALSRCHFGRARAAETPPSALRAFGFISTAAHGPTRGTPTSVAPPDRCHRSRANSPLRRQTATDPGRLKTVAYLGCAAAGLDTSCDSFPYIASHCDDQALEMLASAAELIDALARRIEQALYVDGGPAEAVAA